MPSHPPEVGHSVFSRGYKMNKRVMILNNALRWRHNERDSVSNHQPHDCLLNRLFRRRSKKTSKLRVTGLCVGNSPGTGEFPTQMASYAENVSIWWRHHVKKTSNCIPQIQYVFFFFNCSYLRWNKCIRTLERVSNKSKSVYKNISALNTSVSVF